MFRTKLLGLGLMILLAQISQNISAQNPWTLEQCISYALENNISIKQQELNVKLGENQLTRAKFSAFPSLNASANHNYSFGRTTNFITNQKERIDVQSTSGSLSTQVTLFNGFQIRNTQKQEAINLMANLTDVEKLRNSISLNIAAAYLQILFSQELVESTRKQKELTELQVQRTSQLVKAGSLPEGNLLEIEAQLATDELQLVNYQNQLEMSYLTLTQLLELKSPDDFSIQKPSLEGTIHTEPSDSPSTIFAQAEGSLPQIKSASYRVQSAEKGVLIAEAGFYPRLTLGASYGTGAQRMLSSNNGTSNPFLDQIKDNANINVGFGLSIPIFNGWQVRTSVSNARISLESAKYALEQEKNYLYKDIQQAFVDAVAAMKKFKASEKSVTSLEEAFRNTEQRFSVGLVNSLDYTTSKTRLAKAQADLLSAKYEYIFKSKILDFYRGNQLSL